MTNGNANIIFDEPVFICEYKDKKWDKPILKCSKQLYFSLLKDEVKNKLRWDY